MVATESPASVSSVRWTIVSVVALLGDSAKCVRHCGTNCIIAVAVSRNDRCQRHGALRQRAHTQHASDGSHSLYPYGRVYGIRQHLRQPGKRVHGDDAGLSERDGCGHTDGVNRVCKCRDQRRDRSIQLWIDGQYLAERNGRIFTFLGIALPEPAHSFGRAPLVYLGSA